ncbi:MMPL family transporter [Mycobacterium bourgelatii]|uniref:Membrane protein n=1 Tax=Mycobacterium bourgelatii TaxID=1273442 RepID=A0A7I9YMG4_MYCBU|nr:MMPL family transporter [Mycobacterium bourgelatii]GFG89817.1 membrane protein [Mycobacterium bourgelatii]
MPSAAARTGGTLHRIALAAIAAPRRILAAAALLMVASAIFGSPVAEVLSAGGFTDPASESARAANILASKFDQSDLALLITVTADAGVNSPAATQTAADILAVLKNSPDAVGVTSRWTAPEAAAPALTSTDGKTGVIMAGLRGGDAKYPKIAREIVDRFPPERSSVVVRAGGALTYSEVDEQTKRDLVSMESIAIPVSFVALVWVFGGVLTAALPMMIGMFAILGSLAVLRLIALFTDVSVYAINLTVAMGLALAVDYSLLIVSRYRDEIADGATPNRALVCAMSTAGRTVVFSALTVALSMSALVLFPNYYLRSFAYAGVAVVVLAATAAIVITPAAIALLGRRLDALDVRRLIGRAVRRSTTPTMRPIERSFWYRTAHFVMNHAVAVSVTLIAVLLLLGAPFLGVKWGFPDDRVLPATASSRQVGDLLREKFVVNPMSNVTVVIPEMSPDSNRELGTYAAQLSQVPHVSAVSSPSGTFVAGHLTGPPTAPTGLADGTAFLTIQSNAVLYSDASTSQLRALHAVPGPAGRPVLFTGLPQNNVDSVASITSRLPLVLGVIVVITFAVLFLITGSVVLPPKALVLNVLSLTATFGALVWVFQDGHLGALGTTATGTLVANLPVLMFCIAFGLSMDYEVFLLSRIREFWLLRGNTSQDSDESVALGLARTGRVVTAAALLMTISFAALLTSQVTFVKMLGLGLAIAVLVDATIVRMLLLPALMRLLGRINWWAPAPLTRLHQRIGLAEGPDRMERGQTQELS